MTSTATFSTLLRNPGQVIDRLDEGDVVLTRRDAPNLRLSKDADAHRDDEVISAFAQLIAAVALDEELAPRLARDLTGPFPWLELLPEPHRGEFVAEFLRTARACASVGNFDRLALVLANWRETAAVHAEVQWATEDELTYIPGGLSVADPRTEG